MTEDVCALSWMRCGLVVLGIAALACATVRNARAQDDGSTEVVPGMEDSCIENLGYLACENGMPKAPGVQHLIVVHFAAVLSHQRP